MSLTRKDVVATALVVGAGIITYAKLNDADWWGFGDWRIPTLALFIIGFATCTVIGLGITKISGTWATIATGLGIMAFIITIAGLIFNSQVLFLGLAGIVGILWAVTTVRHIFTDAPKHKKLSY